MSVTSAIAACINKYEAMSFPGGVTKPPIYFDEVPTRTAAGADLNVPYVRLRDLGTTVDYELEYHPMEITTVEFDVYCVQLSDVDAVMNAIKYGTSASTQAGFDFGTLTMTPTTFNACQRTKEVRRLTPVAQNAQVQLVHVGTLTYQIQAYYTW